MADPLSLHDLVRLIRELPSLQHDPVFLTVHRQALADHGLPLFACL